MKTTSLRSGEFTGKHMLLVMLAFFGVIIAVNVAMATLARTSWTGTIVENSYVASQQYNGKIAEARTQAALGWTSQFDLSEGHLRFTVLDAKGKPAKALSGQVALRRPAYDSEDRIIQLQPFSEGAMGADISLRDGIWIAETQIEVGLSHPYRDVQRIVVRNGSLQ